jgi:hypothetical protein
MLSGSSISMLQRKGPGGNYNSYVVVNASNGKVSSAGLDEQREPHHLVAGAGISQAGAFGRQKRIVAATPPLHRGMERQPSFGEWLYARRRKTPSSLKFALVSLALSALTFSTGLWLNYRVPSVTMVPGSPSGVTFDDSQTTGDRAFINRLLSGLNGRPPQAQSVGSCVANGFRLDHLRFQYANGDRLSLTIASGCGPVIVGADYAPKLMIQADSSFLDDLIVNWPTPG